MSELESEASDYGDSDLTIAQPAPDDDEKQPEVNIVGISRSKLVLMKMIFFCF